MNNNSDKNKINNKQKNKYNIIIAIIIVIITRILINMINFTTTILNPLFIKFVFKRNNTWIIVYCYMLNFRNNNNPYFSIVIISKI